MPPTETLRGDSRVKSRPRNRRSSVRRLESVTRHQWLHRSISLRPLGRLHRPQHSLAGCRVVVPSPQQSQPGRVGHTRSGPRECAYTCIGNPTRRLDDGAHKVNTSAAEGDDNERFGAKAHCGSDRALPVGRAVFGHRFGCVTRSAMQAVATRTTAIAPRGHSDCSLAIPPFANCHAPILPATLPRHHRSQPRRGRSVCHRVAARRHPSGGHCCHVRARPCRTRPVASSTTAVVSSTRGHACRSRALPE